MNWCFIGCGSIANTVAKEITKNGRHNVASVYCRTFGNAKKFADKYSAKAYENMQSAIADERVDAVYIATINPSHYPLILQSIACKKPVLCEKPLTLTPEQTAEVFAAALAHDVYLCEGMWTRFNPIIRHIRDIINNGAIGKIKKIKADFNTFARITRIFGINKRLYSAAMGGGALLDLGVYPVAFCQMLLGYPTEIKCTAKSDAEVDLTDKITLYYGDTVCRLSCGFLRQTRAVCEIIGETGKIKMPLFYRPTSAKITVNGKKQVIHCKAGYIHEFDGVESDIKNSKLQSDLMSPTDSIAVAKIIAECKKQI